MNRCVVLDAGALSALAGRPERRNLEVGGVLAAAGAGSRLLADAHVIAAAVDVGGGIALPTDPEDLERLAAAYRNVTVVGLP